MKVATAQEMAVLMYAIPAALSGRLLQNGSRQIPLLLHAEMVPPQVESPEHAL